MQSKDLYAKLMIRFTFIMIAIYIPMLSIYYIPIPYILNNEKLYYGFMESIGYDFLGLSSLLVMSILILMEF